MTVYFCVSRCLRHQRLFPRLEVHAPLLRGNQATLKHRRVEAGVTSGAPLMVNKNNPPTLHFGLYEVVPRRQLVRLYETRAHSAQARPAVPVARARLFWRVLRLEGAAAPLRMLRRGGSGGGGGVCGGGSSSSGGGGGGGGGVPRRERVLQLPRCVRAARAAVFWASKLGRSGAAAAAAGCHARRPLDGSASAAAVAQQQQQQRANKKQE